MTEVSEGFVFLTAQSKQLSATSLLTRPVGITLDGRDLLIGLDVNNQRHLLVPIAKPDIAEDHASRGVTLSSRLLRTGSEDVAFADLHCRIPTLDLVFERLVDDVIDRLEGGAEGPVEACRQALDDWRSLLEKARGGISREALVGLIGELEVLRLLATEAPMEAFDSWRGPARTVHDFVRGSHELEVKATTSVAGDHISVSNLDQLDPGLVEQLHLIVVHVKADATAANLDERIDQLLSLGLPRGALLAKVEEAGYVYETRAKDADDRYGVRSVRAWLVDDPFPGLRRSELAEVRLQGLSKLTYELDVAAFGSPLDEGQTQDLIAGWSKGPA